MDLLWRKNQIITRSISAENRTGEKGKGAMATEGCSSDCTRELGPGWKMSPFLLMPAHEETVLADIEGPGMVKHIWMVPLKSTLAIRTLILRFYWEDSAEPAVEVPFGDFFASPNLEYWQINSLWVCRNPKTGYNCYFEMPFQKKCRITIENRSNEDRYLGYQIDYELREMPDDILYFHAQFRRENPLPYKKDFVILEKVRGKGCFIGTSMLWGITNNGWWGEGEIKFYMDGDDKYPTICGTGTEDYFCGSYDFDVDGKYQAFSTPYTGFYPWKCDGKYDNVKRFSMYRWHIQDPVYFDEDLYVTIQALGWRSEHRYLPLQSADISGVAYFYLDAPSTSRPELLNNDDMEIC
ncbi:MAG: DUF2961 domain-containing protein [Clostridia bacterium]|nr:DUF2961 domain-containing protein [Clostridia bacterium]